MGIDVHALNFIKYTMKRRSLGLVATIGRQEMAVRQLQVQFGRYCEEFLVRRMGAKLVESYDFSDYEGATHIVDMNKPLGQGQYDTVMDCGTLEHVFNVPQALRNVSSLCKTGGQIIHVLPANNFCGHGFWQFSPELFFSLYATKNGYAETEVFLAELRNSSIWYEVVRPNQGRVDITSSGPVYVMCWTVKQSAPCNENIQQSDYIQLWNAGVEPSRKDFAARFKAFLKKSPWIHSALLAFRNALRDRFKRMKNPASLSSRHPHLKKHSVRELLNSQATC